MKTKKYIEEYNIIRVLATLLVVIGHAGYISPMTEYGGISFGAYSIPVAQQIIDLVVRLIYSFHMPLFFALSGALFYLNIEENKFEDLKDLIMIKSRRLLVPFVLCTSFWVVPIKLLSGYWSNSTNILHDIILGQFFLYGNTHLWYLWVLFALTIITWIFRKKDILRFVLCLLFLILGACIEIPAFGVSRIFLNLIWFEIGFQYGKYRNRIQNILATKSRKIFFAAISTSFYVVVLFLYLKLAKGDQFVYSIVHIAGVMMSFGFSFLVIEERIRKSCLYRTVLKHSMGIYLFSDPVNYLILAILKRTTGCQIVETNIGALGLFVFRIYITIIVAIVMDDLVKKLKREFSRSEV